MSATHVAPFREDSDAEKQKPIKKSSSKEESRLRRYIRATNDFANIGAAVKARSQNGSSVYVYTSELNESISIYQAKPGIALLEINVTTRRLTIVGLKHYTQYQAKVHTLILHVSQSIYLCRSIHI